MNRCSESCLRNIRFTSLTITGLICRQPQAFSFLLNAFGLPADSTKIKASTSDFGLFILSVLASFFVCIYGVRGVMGDSKFSCFCFIGNATNPNAKTKCFIFYITNFICNNT